MSEVLALAGKKPVTPRADPQIGQELGISTVLPGVAWDQYIGTSEGLVTNSPLVPIADLIDMRRRDGQARALVRLLTLPIMACVKDSTWVAAEGDTDAEAEVDFANAMFRTPPQAGGMSTPLSKIMRRVLLGLVDGYSAFEEVRQVADKGPLKGKITLRKLAYRDARTVMFRTDDHGGFDGFKQVTTANGKSINVIIPKEKAWYWAANEEENPFYGISYFEAAYTHYDIKRKLYYIAHLAAQFAAVPGRTGKVPRNADIRELQQFKQALADFAFNTAMTYPEDYEVNFQVNTSSFDFLKLIDHHNHMMSRSVLAGFLDTEDRPALVDIAKTDPNADMFVVALESIMNEIAESWSQYLMPKYIDWNFGTAKYPVFRFGELTDDAKAAVQTAFTTVATASVLNTTPEFVREIEMKLADELHLDIDYEEIAKKEKAAAEEAQKQAQAEADAQASMPPALPGGPGVPPAGPGQPPQHPAGPPGPQGPPLPPRVPAAPQTAPLTNRMSTIDDLVEAAQRLLIERPDELDYGDEFDA